MRTGFKIILMTLLVIFSSTITTFAGEPSIVITKGNPSSLSGIPYTIEFYVSDDTGIVSILVNGRELGPNGGTYYDAEWTTYHNGEIVITAVNSEGLSSTATEVITNLDTESITGDYPHIPEAPDHPQETEPEATVPVQTQVQSTPPETQTQVQTIIIYETLPATTAAEETETAAAEEKTEETTEISSEDESAETETNPEDDFKYYVIPNTPQTPKAPPVARLNQIASEAISHGRFFKIIVPRVTRLSRILQAAIVKGSGLMVKSPVVKSLTNIARLALNKGKLYSVPIPHAPSIIKITSQVLKYAGTEINIPSCTDISGILLTAAKHSKGFKITVPKVISLSDLLRPASVKMENLSLFIPKVPDIAGIITSASAVKLTEADIIRPAAGEYTVVSTYTMQQKGGPSSTVLMLISVLLSLILMEISILMLHKKSRKLYIWFVKAYIRKGGL